MRPLSKEGREAVLAISRWAQQVKLSVSDIYHSGKLRAEQTASILAESLLPAQGVHQMSGLGPNDEVSVIESFIHQAPQNILLVGHLPFLNRLASSLLTGQAEIEIIHFHNAGIVCLNGEATCNELSQQSKDAVNWTLDWVMLPAHVM